MDPQQIDAILRDLPPSTGISKLEPFKELIRSLRQRRTSYARITAILLDKCGVSVAASTVHNFVKTRAKPKPVMTMLPDVQTPAAPDTAARGAESRPRRRFHLDF